MNKLPHNGFIEKLRQHFQWITGFRVGLYAAHASFFIILSLIPTLVLLLGLLRYTGLDATNLLSMLDGFFPEALLPLVSRLVQNLYRNSSGTVLSISVIGMLWSAGRGIYGLIIGLNAIYGVKESRGYFRTRLVSTGYMFAFLAILLITLILNVYSHSLLDFIAAKINISWLANWPSVLRFILPFALQVLLFTAMYVVFPNEKIKIRQALPGSVLSAIGWMVFSKLYSVYLVHFSDYVGVYDSLYSLAVCLLWLYFCISILFYGGVFNCYVIQRKNSSKF